MATVITGAEVPAVPVNLKPPLPKLVAEWQALQATVAAVLSGGMWFDAGVTMVATPFQLSLMAWQVSQAAFALAWPAAESTGLVLLMKKPAPLLVIVSLLAWQPLALQLALPSGKWVVLVPPAVPTAPFICQGWPLLPCPVPEKTVDVLWQVAQLGVPVVTSACFIVETPGA